MSPSNLATRGHRWANKPHYVFRPGQTMRRLRYSVDRWDIDQRVVASLPWGLPLECWPRDLVGSSVLRTGIYDLLATEATFRLADSGETAVDAGANVGYMTSALARAVGGRGRVLSFEPHPVVHAVLQSNVQSWGRMKGVAAIYVHRLALSDRGGSGAMATGDDFAANHGLARVLADDERGSSQHVPISLVRLDELTQGPVGVLKLDVEGHELKALVGAESLLRERAVRDIVFEEHARYPTPVTSHLENFGFEIFGLEQRLTGPRLSHPSVAHTANPWNPPVLIATIDGSRLRSRIAQRGWLALRRPNAWVRGFRSHELQASRNRQLLG